jgi:hypothetical protein
MHRLAALPQPQQLALPATKADGRNGCLAARGARGGGASGRGPRHAPAPVAARAAGDKGSEEGEQKMSGHFPRCRGASSELPSTVRQAGGADGGSRTTRGGSGAPLRSLLTAAAAPSEPGFGAIHAAACARGDHTYMDPATAGRCRLKPIETSVESAWLHRLKPTYDEPLSNFAFNSKLRRYITGYTVMTRLTHEARGSCCCSDCRHSPFVLGGGTEGPVTGLGPGLGRAGPVAGAGPGPGAEPIQGAEAGTKMVPGAGLVLAGATAMGRRNALAAAAALGAGLLQLGPSATAAAAVAAEAVSIPAAEAASEPAVSAAASAAEAAELALLGAIPDYSVRGPYGVRRLPKLVWPERYRLPRHTPHCRPSLPE